MSEVSGQVKGLYERYPFPSRGYLGKRRLFGFLRWVLPAFGEKSKAFFSGKKVLDVGCGTGEFATALALAGAEVIGIDFSGASIKKARAFAKKHKAKGIGFKRVDLFDFEPKERFDIVFCLGVLHHTESAEKAFAKIVSFCAPKGFVCVGLYNKFARAKHRVKRIALRVLAGKNVEKRIVLAKELFPKAVDRSEAWLADKFGQLQESYHSASEVLEWFEKNSLLFVGSRPRLKKPFWLEQLKWLFGKRGAFFVMVGKKQ